MSFSRRSLKVILTIKPVWSHKLLKQNAITFDHTLVGYKVAFVPFKNGKPSGSPEDFLIGFIAEEGRHYTGEDIPDPSTRPDLADAKIHWTPVISPSGMAFYDGDLFSDLKGNMLIGGLSSQGLVRVEVNDDQAKEAGRIDLNARIRDVEQAPDGSIYVLTDKRDGSVLKLVPNTLSKGR